MGSCYLPTDDMTQVAALGATQRGRTSEEVQATLGEWTEQVLAESVGAWVNASYGKHHKYTKFPLFCNPLFMKIKRVFSPVLERGPRASCMLGTYSTTKPWSWPTYVCCEWRVNTWWPLRWDKIQNISMNSVLGNSRREKLWKVLYASAAVCWVSDPSKPWGPRGKV